MGCSSSSAQTVDQEKRPGTKPEDSSGDTVAIKNGIIAEEAQTIKDQMQLPVQTALKDDLKLVPEEEAEEVLMAMEAQEDLGSGEDLLTLPEPVCQEHAPEPLASSPVEGPAEPEAAVAGREVIPPGEEEAAVETEQGEVSPGLEVLVEAKEESPKSESVEENFAEELIPEPAGTPVVMEEARSEPAEAPAEAPSGDVTAEEQTDSAAPETSASDEAQTSNDAPEPSVASVPTEAAAPAEPSAPAGAVGPIIDTVIAAATVPEIPSLSAAMTQDEPQPPTEQAGEVSPASDQPLPPAEAPCPPEATTVPPVEVESAAEPVPAPAPSLTETPSPAPAEEAPLVTSGGADAAVVESIPEPSAEVASVDEVSQESEAVIKEN